jgi:hypothetical protein
MFRQAEQAASFPSMCYVNADIILSSDFLRALELVRRKYPRSLVISKRITFDVSEHLNFDEHWEPSIKERARASGRDDHYTCIDVFAFSKGMYPHIPDFAIGRLWFDHWLIKAIRLQNLPVVDVSLVAPVLHQNHDYNHVAGGFKQVWQGQEAARNFELYGGVKHAYTLLDVTHKLTSDGSVRRVLFRKPLFTLKQFAWENFVHRTGRLRKVVGLRRKLKEPAANQSS